MNTNAIQNTNSLHSIMSEMELGPSNSIQFLFAKLQLAQAQLCKNKAQAYIDKIQKSQEEQKECAKMIEKARELQQKAKNEKAPTTMPQEMIDYFNKNGISYNQAGKDTLHSNEEWDYNIKSLLNLQETFGTSTQTDLVFLNDFMGQYNSYLQGAHSTIQQNNQTLTNILRG